MRPRPVERFPLGEAIRGSGVIAMILSALAYPLVISQGSPGGPFLGFFLLGLLVARQRKIP